MAARAPGNIPPPNLPPDGSRPSTRSPSPDRVTQAAQRGMSPSSTPSSEQTGTFWTQRNISILKNIRSFAAGSGIVGGGLVSAGLIAAGAGIVAGSIFSGGLLIFMIAGVVAAVASFKLYQQARKQNESIDQSQAVIPQPTDPSRVSLNPNLTEKWSKCIADFKEDFTSSKKAIEENFVAATTPDSPIPSSVTRISMETPRIFGNPEEKRRCISLPTEASPEKLSKLKDNVFRDLYKDLERNFRIQTKTLNIGCSKDEIFNNLESVYQFLAQEIESKAKLSKPAAQMQALHVLFACSQATLIGLGSLVQSFNPGPFSKYDVRQEIQDYMLQYPEVISQITVEENGIVNIEIRSKFILWINDTADKGEVWERIIHLSTLPGAEQTELFIKDENAPNENYDTEAKRLFLSTIPDFLAEASNGSITFRSPTEIR